jgi:hypothetical protein
MGIFIAMRESLKHSWWGMILAEHDTEPVELIGGATKVAMGLWLLLPFDTFGSSRTFSALAVFPESAWGAFFLVVGLAHLAALYDGRRTWRAWASGIGFVIWFAFALVFVTTNPPAFGWIMFMSVALAQMWASVRLGQPA